LSSIIRSKASLLKSFDEDEVMLSADKEHFNEVLDKFPQQIREAALLTTPSLHQKFSTLFFCGVGGSGMPGEIVKRIISDWPVILVKNYELPSYVGRDSLVFVVSYSGNTEETLETYNQLKQRDATVIAVASGGMLAQQAKEDGCPCIVVPTPSAGPSGFQPRMAIGYQTIPVLNTLARAGLAETIQWKKIADFLDSKKREIKEHAQKLAARIGKKIPIIYSSEHFYAAALKWKIDFNENSKIHSFSHHFPEFNHNEINGYVHGTKNVIVFILRDKDDHPRNLKRIDVISKLLIGKGIDLQVIDSVGSTFVERVFWTIWLGDWVSYYTALSNNVDPTPVAVIEELKKMLK